MKLKFDFGNVKATEFGLGRDNGDGQDFVMVPVDAKVQKALREMADATFESMRRDAEQPAKYEPSEKHGSAEYLYLPLNDELAESIRVLHEAENLPMDGAALNGSDAVFCYFARLTDNQNRRLTALRRATQFKGVLKSRLLQVVTDSLKLIEDRVFKLDTDFDLLVDSENLHILRPSGFEFAGKLQEAILAAVPENMKAIRKDISFVEFDGIEQYASRHPRAARYLASILGQAETKNIDKSALKKHCKQNGVEISETKGTITVTAGHEMGFLEVLDRRRYQSELIKGKPERFRAGSRQKLEN